MINHVIGAGVDYESSGRGFRGMNFREFAIQRRRQLFKVAPRGADIRIVVLDFLSGTRETVSIRWQDGKATESKAIEKYRQPITSKSYKGHAFRDNQPDVMSIVDVYKEVLTIGKDHPGTLGELSIFSHGNYIGPIMVNSFEDNTHREGSSLELRDPDDKDGRGGKDFTGRNMTAEELVFLRSAFSKEGLSWLWGCNFPDDIHKMLSRVEKTGKSLGGDGEVIELKRLTAEEVKYFGMYRSVLKIDGSLLLKENRCKFLLGDFKNLIAELGKVCYSHHLAVASGAKVVSALLGTYAVPELSSRGLLVIQKDTLKHVRFHEKHFGIATDPEGRGYGTIIGGK